MQRLSDREDMRGIVFLDGVLKCLATRDTSAGASELLRGVSRRSKDATTRYTFACSTALPEKILNTLSDYSEPSRKVLRTYQWTATVAHSAPSMDLVGIQQATSFLTVSDLTQ